MKASSHGVGALKTRGLAAGSTVRMLVALAGITAIFTVLNPVFLSTQNIENISVSASEILILACGTTFVIVSGNLDLSIGSQLMLSAIVSTLVWERLGDGPGSAVVGVVILLAVGAVFGLLNGVLTVGLNVPSFIVTLGTLGIGLGAAQLMTASGGSASKPAPEWITDLGLADVLGIPVIVIFALTVLLFSAVLLSQTRFGLHCAAIGSNKEGARRSGVHVDRTTVVIFVVMGLYSAIAGFVDLMRFTSVSTASHQSDNLTAIAAVIIGGASLFGGKASIFGSLVGTLIPVVLLQGFVIEGVNPFWQNIAIGTVLIVAVALDQTDRASKRRKAAVSELS